MNKILSLLVLFSTIAISRACDTWCANNSVLNKTVGPTGSVDQTAWFFDGGIFPPSVFLTQDGTCGLQVNLHDNDLTITGVVYAINDPTTGFFINIQSTKATSLDPFLELQPAAYKANGGPIDPSTWVQYTLVRGALTGFGAYKDTLINLAETMHPLQLGNGANGKNFNYGLSAWFDFTGEDGQTHMSDINLDLSCKDVVCYPNWNVTAAIDGYSFTYRNTDNQETKFTFVDPTGIFVEDATLSSAVLGGQIRYVTGFSATSEICTVAAIFTRDLTYNMPHQELPASAYKANGGPIDPTTWRYYSLVAGSIDCPSSHTDFKTYEGMDFQVGYGANDKNYNFGASGWFDFNITVNGQITQRGILDINVDLICGPLAPTPAPPTSAPVTSAPVTSAPVTSAPVTSAPVTSAPVTSAPVTSAPVTSAPVTSAPVTSAPVTSAPVTSAPVTSAPVTSAPVTSAPVTSGNTDGSTSSNTDGSTSSAATSGNTDGSTSDNTDGSTSGNTDGSTSGNTDGSTSGNTVSSDETNACPPNPFTAQQAIADQFGGNSYFAFIFNTTTNVQYRFNFENNAGYFKINSDGSAELTGNLVPLSSNPDDGYFNFNFGADFKFNQGSRPAEYHKELKPEAYVPQGPVNPDTWQFFSFGSATATVSTAGYSLSIVPFMDMQLQVGAGANGKNINYGASNWFYFYLVANDASNTLVAEGVMDIDVDLVCQGGSGSGTGSATTSAASGSGTGSVSGGEVAPSTTAPTAPATTASASTLSLSMLILVAALVLNL